MFFNFLILFDEYNLLRVLFHYILHLYPFNLIILGWYIDGLKKNFSCSYFFKILYFKICMDIVCLIKFKKIIFIDDKMVLYKIVVFYGMSKSIYHITSVVLLDSTNNTAHVVTSKYLNTYHN